MRLLTTLAAAAVLAASLSTTALAQGADWEALQQNSMSSFSSWNDPQRMNEQGHRFRSAWPSWRSIERRAARAASGQSWSRGYFSDAAPANGSGTGFNGGR